MDDDLDQMIPSPETPETGAAAKKVEFLWGTVIKSMRNPSPEITLKAYDDSAVPAGSTSATPFDSGTVPWPGRVRASGPLSMTEVAASLTIRTSRLGNADSVRRNGEVKNADGTDFVITGPLGRGGMGVVYSARQSSLNRDVAVKMISPESSGKDAARKKMVAEALVTGELDHPNIIPIHELGRTETGELFYAMKIVNGVPWSQSLSGKSERENIEILLRICDAVAFAHDKDILHRDLKPANVMLGNYGEVLLMDWGLAVSLTPSEKAETLSPFNAVAGTPAYMAPEMAMGDYRRIGKASDIYLLGAILYEIVTGQRPHGGADASECLNAAAENKIRPALADDDLTRVALRAMATKPASRYPSVKEFQNAIVTVQTHRESHRLAWNAAETLRDAVARHDYESFAHSIFAYGEAVRLWSGNEAAVRGVVEARMEYARCAFEKGDFDLAFSNAQELDIPEARELAAKINGARAELSARKRRIRLLTRTAVGLIVAVLVILAASVVIISDRMSRERAARRLAGEALEETQIARRNERIAAKEREAALLQQREAQEAALVAAADRENALRREMAALARAEEERRRKEEAEVAKLEIERELTRKGQLEDDSWWGFDAAAAREKQNTAAATWNTPVTLRAVFADKTRFDAESEFALIPPGVFVMGSSPTARHHAPDEYLHRVELHNPFYMGRAEVTRAEWRAVAGLESEGDLMPPFNPEVTDETEESFRERELKIWGWRTRPIGDGEGALPATGVSPDEVDRLFVAKVRDAAPDGWITDLPTEAEWEFACRAGTSTDYFSGNIGPGQKPPGWMRVNSGVRPHPVMRLEANPWGLYDTHGNAGEIVRDNYDSTYYRASPEADPVNISASDFRVFRGGTYIHEEGKCRSASRFTIYHANRYAQVGFRLALRKR